MRFYLDIDLDEDASAEDNALRIRQALQNVAGKADIDTLDGPICDETGRSIGRYGLIPE